VPLVDRLGEIDPDACRAHVERNFAPEQMVNGYEEAYRDCLASTAG
jgi:hypothetical protein